MERLKSKRLLLALSVILAPAIVWGAASIHLPATDILGALSVSGTTTTNLTTAGPVITSAGGLLTSEAQLTPGRGGTGQNFSASTGIMKILAGTVSVGSVSVNDLTGAITTTNGGTGQNLSASTGVLKVLSGTVSAGSVSVTDLTGAITTTNGGTGQNLSASTGPLVVTSGTVSASSIALATQVSGVLPIANGGTNNATLGVVDGSMYYASASKILSMGAGTAGQVPVSAGSTVAWGTPQGGLIGDRELISNTNIEVNVTGYTAYADAAGTVPVDCTGGSPNSTATRSTSTPITGAGELLWTKSGSANRQGEGFSIPFTVGTADQAKVLQIDLDYIVRSGTFVAGTSTADSDLTIYLYDVTNSTLIYPSTSRLYSNSTTISDHFRSNFQTSATGTSYRLCIHQGTTVTANTTLGFDNISIHPSKYTYGTPISDWASYTPTLAGFGTVTGLTASARRVGGSREVMALWTNGTVAGSLASITLPLGDSINTSVLTLGNTTSNAGHIVGTRRGAAANNAGPLVTATGTSAILVYFGAQVTGSSGLTPQNGSTIETSSEVMSVQFSYPIAGASSSVEMSDTADQRILAAAYYVSANFAATTTTPVNFDTKEIDTHAAVTTSSTAWKFTAPTAGIYVVSMTGGTTATVGVTIFKNGSAYKNLGNGNGANSGGYNATLISLIAGDFIDIRPTGNASFIGGTLQVTQGTNISISKLSGSMAIGATELIAASYSISTNFAATTSVPINFDTKEYDTHNAVTPSATVWVFTAPAAGIYQVSAALIGNTSGKCLIYKNGSAFKNLGGVTSTTTAGLIADIRLIAGDTIAIRPDQNVTFTGGTLSTAGTGTVSIKRIGL